MQIGAFKLDNAQQFVYGLIAAFALGIAAGWLLAIPFMMVLSAVLVVTWFVLAFFYSIRNSPRKLIEWLLFAIPVFFFAAWITEAVAFTEFFSL